MAEGRIEESWTHTAEILAMLYNANRDPKRSRPMRASEFNPCVLAKRKRQVLRKGDLAILKDVFVKEKKR